MMKTSTKTTKTTKPAGKTATAPKTASVKKLSRDEWQKQVDTLAKAHIGNAKRNDGTPPDAMADKLYAAGITPEQVLLASEYRHTMFGQPVKDPAPESEQKKAIAAVIDAVA